VSLEEIGGMVAEELHAVAALDEGHALGDEALQLDGADFGAVLFLLRLFLRVLIGVELAGDPFCRAVIEVDLCPEQIVKIGLQPRIA
jgi:hypothetical protein